MDCKWTEYLKLCGINPLDRAYDDIINLGLELGLGAGLGGLAGALLAGLLEAARGGWCSEHCVLSVKVPKSLVSRSVWKPDMDFDRLKCIT